jgi:hypothetical protein
MIEAVFLIVILVVPIALVLTMLSLAASLVGLVAENDLPVPPHVAV